MFVNDIVNDLEVNCLLYADDLKLFKVINSQDDCILLQNNLCKINDWCFRNKLELNVSKCNIMTYTTITTPLLFNYTLATALLQRPSTFRDLGVTFDKELSFAAHIDQVTSDSFKMLGWLIRCSKDFSNVNTLKILYFAFVRSKIKYCSLVWNPKDRKSVV